MLCTRRSDLHREPRVPQLPRPRRTIRQRRRHATRRPSHRESSRRARTSSWWRSRRTWRIRRRSDAASRHFPVGPGSGQSVPDRECRPGSALPQVARRAGWASTGPNRRRTARPPPIRACSIRLFRACARPRRRSCPRVRRLGSRRGAGRWLRPRYGRRSGNRSRSDRPWAVRRGSTAIGRR